MNKLVEIFCDIDDFYRLFIPQWEQFCLDNGYRLRRRQGHMSPSEIMTILILFQQSHYRDFKNFYLAHIWQYHHRDFPTLLSYPRFISVAPSVLVPLSSYLTQLKGKPTGIAFIDSTSLRVCAFATTSVFLAIRSSRASRNAEKPRWGAMVSNYTWLLTIWAKF